MKLYSNITKPVTRIKREWKVIYWSKEKRKWEVLWTGKSEKQGEIMLHKRYNNRVWMGKRLLVRVEHHYLFERYATPVTFGRNNE